MKPWKQYIREGDYLDDLFIGAIAFSIVVILGLGLPW